MQKDANLVELEKCCQTHIFLQNFVLIQPRTSPPKICKIFEKCIFEKCIFENAFSKKTFGVAVLKKEVNVHSSLRRLIYTRRNRFRLVGSRFQLSLISHLFRIILKAFPPVAKSPEIWESARIFWPSPYKLLKFRKMHQNWWVVDHNCKKYTKTWE